jgi:ectoine hydroxylase-related dioxygenase (phytanoyl-CoA dioxygenase family)
VLWQCITPAHRAAFEADGFVVIESLIGAATCNVLQQRLEAVLRGNGDLGLPDKAPTFRAEPRCKKGKVPPALGGPSKRTLQLINCWKADSEFRALVHSRRLGEVVATLAGWSAGARVANDQIWAKPPGARALSFHRDSAYFDFVPADVVTVWIALDDMDHELGPLEYVHGSHKWRDASGSAAQFFVRGGGGHRDHLLAAAALEKPPRAERDLVIREVNVRAGGCGIHNGRLWHGSGRNSSRTKPRRGLGVHFVPADAVFRDVSSRATLAARQAFGNGGGAATSASAALDDALFPVTWRPAP